LPDAASTWFPSNDHPSDKATFTFRITVPKGRSVVANGRLQSRTGNTFVWVEDSPMADEYRRIVDALRDSVDFMEAVSGHRLSETRRVDFYTSHEGLSLLYEQAQTRRVPRRDGWYNLSTHLPWLGMRTAQVGGAHVEYFRGIANPIAVKVGEGTEATTLAELVRKQAPRAGEVAVLHDQRPRASGDHSPETASAA